MCWFKSDARLEEPRLSEPRSSQSHSYAHALWSFKWSFATSLCTCQLLTQVSSCAIVNTYLWTQQPQVDKRAVPYSGGLPCIHIFYDVPNMTADPTPDTDIFHDPMPDDDVFHAMQSDTMDTDGLYYFDPTNLNQVAGFVGCAFHLTLDSDDVIDSCNVGKFLFLLNYDKLQGAHEEFDSFAYVSHAATQDQAHKYVEYLKYQPVDIIQKMLENTTQLTMTTLHFLMW